MTIRKGKEYVKWQNKMRQRRERIREMAKAGISYPEIGKLYGISRQRARQIALGE